VPESTTPEKLLEAFVEFIAQPGSVMRMNQKEMKKHIPEFLKKWRSEP
jgi:hypothetical protein